VTTDQKSRNDEPAEGTEAVESAEATDAVDGKPTESEEADTAAATAEDESKPVDKKSSGRLWARISVAVLAVLLIASAGLTAWLYVYQYRVDQQTGPEASQVALQAAKDGTVALLSYAPETLDKDLAAAKSHLTGDFLNYYSQFTDQVVRPAATQKKVKTTATVARGAVSDIHPDTATVLLFVNQLTMSAERQEPSATSSSVLVKLTKVNGTWLISSFDPV
jgi:Mce-associated membrane protein